MSDVSFNFLTDQPDGTTYDVLLNTPILQTESYNIIGYSVYSVTIKLFTSCTVYLLIHTDKGTQISKSYTLTTEQYLNWNNDDSYILDLVNGNITEIISS